MRIILAFWIWILTIGAAVAGPWPRGDGQHYLSFALSQDVDAGQPWQSLYHEWGVTDRTTLILRQGTSFDGKVNLLAAISRDIWPGRRVKLAWSLGAGLHENDPAAMAGLSVGRSFQIAGRAAWLATEFQALATRKVIVGTTEVTVGVTTARGIKFYGQLSSRHFLHDPAPVTVVIPPGPFFGPPPVTTITWFPPEVRLGLNASIPVREGLAIDLGISQGVQQGGTRRVKLGITAEF
ncbi:hypothetical protein [Pseudooceanicola sp. MF1-13]|uniref:hypothetical protein n=1 Tax=Pseudooceanicola sp. MF1-13 TaxID=3379095 RepID=UPI0038921FB1